MGPMMRLTLGVIALIAIMAGVAFALPSHVTVKRDIVINAPESAVFPYLNNLRRFSEWSPWAARDDNLNTTYGGPEEGVGARLQWSSNRGSVGSGVMQITKSEPNSSIEMGVNFNGLEGTSFYEIEPSGSGSKLIWGFGYDTGTGPYKRWKGLMLDRFVGIDYRDGLARLKEKIETERRPVVPTVTVVPEETPAAADGEVPAAGEPGAEQPQAEAAPEAAPAPNPQPQRPKRRR